MADRNNNNAPTFTDRVADPSRRRFLQAGAAVTVAAALPSQAGLLDDIAGPDAGKALEAFGEAKRALDEANKAKRNPAAAIPPADAANAPASGFGDGRADLTQGLRLNTAEAIALAKMIEKLASTPQKFFENFSGPRPKIDGNIRQITDIITTAPSAQKPQLIGNMVLQAKMQLGDNCQDLLTKLLGQLPEAHNINYVIKSGGGGLRENAFIGNFKGTDAELARVQNSQVNLLGLLTNIELGNIPESARRIITVPDNLDPGVTANALGSRQAQAIITTAKANEQRAASAGIGR